MVCVEILDDESLDHDKGDESYNYEETAVADFVGESTIESIEGLADQKRRKSISGKEKSQQGVYGRVVGIIRRNWRQYAGSIIPLESDSTAATSADLLQNSGQNDEENLVSQALFVPVSPKIPKVLVISRFVMSIVIAYHADMNGVLDNLTSCRVREFWYQLIVGQV